MQKFNRLILTGRNFNWKYIFAANTRVITRHFKRDGITEIANTSPSYEHLSEIPNRPQTKLLFNQNISKTEHVDALKISELYYTY